MKLHVMSRSQVEDPERYQKLIDESHFLLSIAPGEAKIAEHPLLLYVLSLEFHDIDNEEVAKRNNLDMMTEKHAMQILSFAKLAIDSVDTIVCQCEAGISRSAGAAAALDLILNHTDAYWWNHRLYLPNCHVYRMILKAFNKCTDDYREALSGHTCRLGSDELVKRFLRNDIGKEKPMF